MESNCEGVVFILHMFVFVGSCNAGILKFKMLNLKLLARNNFVLFVKCLVLTFFEFLI